MSGAFPVLLISSLKAYYRNRGALFFTLLVPLIILVIFGLLNLGSSTSEKVGVADQAHNAASRQLVAGLRQVSALQVSEGSETDLKAALDHGDLALVVVLPPSFGSAPQVTVPIYGNQAKPQDTEIARAIVQQFFNQASIAATGRPPAFQVDYQAVRGRNLTYVDFLLPGIVAFSIMQTGVFSVAFAFVQAKQNGVLRRLMATPMRVLDYLAAQVVTRLIMSIVQLGILLGVGLVFLHFHLTGNLAELLVPAIGGAAVFIAMGFAISGYAKSEESVPALANILTMPMMFLSGVFFSRNGMPDWLHRMSDVLPLTYVTDALRAISIDGSHLWSPPVLGDLLGIAIWMAIAIAVALRLFRWEVT